MSNYNFQKPETEIIPLQCSRNNLSTETGRYYSEHSLYSSHNILAGNDATNINSASWRNRELHYTNIRISLLLYYIGIGVFSITMYRVVILGEILLDKVFDLYINWLISVKTTFGIVAIGMGVLLLKIIFCGFRTSKTHLHMYNAWRNQVGGRISCAIFMGIIYLLQFFWIVIFGILTITAFVMSVFWNLCTQVQDSNQCIDLTKFHFLFPESTRIEHLKICEKYAIQFVCRDFVEQSEYMFIIGAFGVILILICLAHYFICLSANYVRIREQKNQGL